MFTRISAQLAQKPAHWVVTGVAGFIGSNILEKLLRLGQVVTGLDNMSTGNRENLASVLEKVGPTAAARFSFIAGDIRDLDACKLACCGADYVLHQAALGSVPRSIEEPISFNEVNVNGFMNMLVASRDSNIKRFVFASSSSVYGDSPELPKRECAVGRQLSPYAVTKYVNELYSYVFGSCYNMSIIGLRYFNIFGPHQDPQGAYAAVIPKWFSALLSGDTIFINGDGSTSRDFCFVDNAVQSNLLAALTKEPEASGKVYNVACGKRTTLNELYISIRNIVALLKPEVEHTKPVYLDERPGDIKHSLADISLSMQHLGYQPLIELQEGLQKSAEWYCWLHGIVA